jgi:Xaa-Pro aminopeptidase
VQESAGAILVTRRGDDWLLTDSRYLDAARRLWPEERIFILRPPGPPEHGAFLRGGDPGAAGFRVRLA